MTILILTLHERFAVLSQDTVISDERVLPEDVAPGVTTDADEQRRGAFVGDGTPPDDLLGLGQHSKITIAPHLRLVAGYVGHLHSVTKWDAFLRYAPAADIWDLNNRVISDLRHNWGEPHEADRHTMAFLVGWSNFDDCMRATLNRAETQWKGVDLPTGHHLYPACDPDDPEYGALEHQAARAAEGQDVEEFHVAIAKNIHRAFLHGRYRKGVVIGGQLHTVRLEGDSITVKVAHTFDL